MSAFSGDDLKPGTIVFEGVCQHLRCPQVESIDYLLFQFINILYRPSVDFGFDKSPEKEVARYIWGLRQS